MRAITTTYHGPGNVRGSKIIATDGDGNRATVPYRCELSSNANHQAAARALCEKMVWTGRLQGGHTEAGMAFCWIDRDNQITAPRAR